MCALESKILKGHLDHRCAAGIQLVRMAQKDTRGLVLSALAGAAGISLVVVLYRNWRGRGPWREERQGRGEAAGLTASGGTALALQARQVEVVDQLGALIQCMTELKDEVRALKDALPRLPEQVRAELRGRGAEGGHRTPRRKRPEGTVREAGHSSEEAESEGGYVTAHTDSEEEEGGGGGGGAWRRGQG
ncbi:hypothetical protein GJAV_G00239910 [Gymnothorax javanicus]|nr:hypothetical protein GJAV_G00239910 [Gymnothorax javanicus]